MTALSLLDGFRATQLFIAPFARQDLSAGLWDLASWMAFVNGGVGPPRDQAMWSDWLDAALAVKPQWNEVKDARARIEREHAEFVRLQDAGASKDAMDVFRAKLAGRTWHRVGHAQCTPIEAFEFMRAFLDAFWKRGLCESKDVALLLQTLTADASMPENWRAWRAALAAARSLPSIPPSS